jgi:hypothetical protein
LKLRCYALDDYPMPIAPARVRRDWMDANHHAYHCLPLAIANTAGWELSCPAALELEWNGGPAASDLAVRALTPLPGGRPIGYFCHSHFTHGIVTFFPSYLFATEPGWDLAVSGPFNQPKDNACPLTGIVEADWLAYPFTMNWQLLRPGTVRFEAGEPFCLIFPLQLEALAQTRVEILRLADNPALAAEHRALREARERAWPQRQSSYFFGRHGDGRPAARHRGRLRLAEPVDRRAEVPRGTAMYPAVPTGRAS